MGIELEDPRMGAHGPSGRRGTPASTISSSVLGKLLALSTVAILAMSSCSKKKESGQETEAAAQAEAKQDGLPALDVLKLHQIASAEELKDKLEEWGDFAEYKSGTVYIDIAHSQFRKFLIKIDEKTGLPLLNFSLWAHESTQGEAIDALAARLELLHLLFRPKERSVVDAVEGTFRYDFGGRRASLTKVMKGWQLSICWAYDAQDIELSCWRALEQVLLNRVRGVDPDCYGTGEHCVKSRLQDVESIAGNLMASIKVSDQLDMSSFFSEGDLLISYVERNGETSILLKSTNPKGGIARLAAKAIAGKLPGLPAAEGVTSVIFKDASGVEEAFPL